MRKKKMGFKRKRMKEGGLGPTPLTVKRWRSRDLIEKEKKKTAQKKGEEEQLSPAD